jgi:hypothetical protein
MIRTAPLRGEHQTKRAQTLLELQAKGNVLQSYSLHANCYITKPVDVSQFTQVVHSICDFCLEMVKSPSHE